MAVSSSTAPQAPDAAFFRNFILAWAEMRGYETESLRGHACARRSDHNRVAWERVCIEPSREEFEIMSNIIKKSDSSALSIIAADPEPYKELGKQQGFDLLCDEAVMTIDFGGDTMSLQASSNRDQFETETLKETSEDRVVFRLKITQEGKPAAKGQICVDGKIAIFDRITTEEAMRRRGLGSLVMRTLAEDAVGAGADKGWLIASPQGQLLYERLGWKTAYRLVAFGDKALVADAAI